MEPKPTPAPQPPPSLPAEVPADRPRGSEGEGNGNGVAGAAGAAGAADVAGAGAESKPKTKAPGHSLDVMYDPALKLVKGELCEAYHCRSWEPAVITKIVKMKSGKNVYFKLKNGIGSETTGYKLRAPQLSSSAPRKRARKKTQVHNVARQPAPKPKAKRSKRDSGASDANPGQKEAKSKALKGQPSVKDMLAKAKRRKRKIKVEEDILDVADFEEPETLPALPAKKTPAESKKKVKDKKDKKKEDPGPPGINGDTLTIWSRGLWLRAIEFNIEDELKRRERAAKRAQKTRKASLTGRNNKRPKTGGDKQLSLEEKQQGAQGDSSKLPAPLQQG